MPATTNKYDWYTGNVISSANRCVFTSEMSRNMVTFTSNQTDFECICGSQYGVYYGYGSNQYRWRILHNHVECIPQVVLCCALDVDKYNHCYVLGQIRWIKCKACASFEISAFALMKQISILKIHIINLTFMHKTASEKKRAKDALRGNNPIWLPTTCMFCCYF